MSTSRTLRLEKDVLTELTAGDMASVVAASGVGCVVSRKICLTDAVCETFDTCFTCICWTDLC